MPSKGYEPEGVGVHRREMSLLVKGIKEGLMEEDASRLGLEG